MSDRRVNRKSLLDEYKKENRRTDIIEQFESQYKIDRSGLSFPQQLELLLKFIQTDEDNSCEEIEDKIGNLFNNFFLNTGGSSKLHKRIYELFPTIVTTNYDNPFSDFDDKVVTIDMTDPNEGFDTISFRKKAIYHLHGLWEPTNLNDNESRQEKKKQIFWGINEKYRNPHKCLVLTEYQYHRLYMSDKSFALKVEKVFDPENMLLIIGAKWSPDEMGIHHLLREHKISHRKKSIGILLAFEIDDISRELLEKRGIITITLPTYFGLSRFTLEALLHAFIDVCEERFTAKYDDVNPKTNGNTEKYDKFRTIPFPEIICAGLSSVSDIISTKDIPTRETSYLIGNSNSSYIKQASGQHLLPALYLVQKGLKVALASRIGEDAEGDYLWDFIKEIIKDEDKEVEDKEEDKEKESPYLNTMLVKREGKTRKSIVITFDGQRIIYDYYSPNSGESSDGKKYAEMDQSLKYTEDLLSKFTRVTGLYLGPLMTNLNNQLIEQFGGCEYRFFETGTSGSGNEEIYQGTKTIARQCNYVLASAEWAIRIALESENGKYPITDFKSQEQYQSHFKADYKAIAEKTCNYLWKKDELENNEIGNNEIKSLIIVMGKHGSVCVNMSLDGQIHVSLPIEPSEQIDGSKGRNWLGCGDIFRAEFINQILKEKADIEIACREASKVVCEKIKVMPLLPQKGQY